MAKLDPPLKWHGGKHYLASRIIAMMPPHVHYVEPYFGGGAVMLAKDYEGISEVANDINGSLYHFWKMLQEPAYFQAVKKRLEATPFSEDEFNASKALPIEVSWEEKAASFFIQCRQSLAGRMKDFATLSRNRIRRGINEQASAWLTAIEGLPIVHERLKRVVILNRDALDVIRQQDGEHTLFYLDPPYLHETRATTGEYAHEMTREQHAQLLLSIAAIKGKFLLSGYDSELYRNYEKDNGWKRTEFELPNNSAGGDVKRRMKEIVWSNY